MSDMIDRQDAMMDIAYANGMRAVLGMWAQNADPERARELADRRTEEALRVLQARAAPQTKECPNCHNANSCGDYEGPTCEVCNGVGTVPSSLTRVERE